MSARTSARRADLSRGWAWTSCSSAPTSPFARRGATGSDSSGVREIPLANPSPALHKKDAVIPVTNHATNLR
jgi:hypothetical protein